MDETSKKTNWKAVIAVALVVLLAISFFKIAELSDAVENLQRENTSLSNGIQALRDDIHSIYNNVDAKLKEQASLVSGVDFEIGDISEDMKSVELTLTVVPKLVTDDMEVSISVDGKTVPLTKTGSGFAGAVDVGLFVGYNQWPLLSIKSAEGTKTEYLDSIDVSYLYSRHLPSLYADMSASSKLSNSKLQVDAGFSIETKPANSNSPITFVSFTLIEEINGEEVSRSDITDEVQKSGNSYDTRYIKSFEMSQEDELRVYVIAEDTLGYVHKTLVHLWVQSEPGAVAEAVFGGELIYDKDGNLLYGDKELWG